MMSLASPAKINLFLHVTGKRPDGYHELFSLMSCIAIFDHIRLDFGGCAIEVECAHPQVPRDETNLAWRAASAFYAACGEKNPPGLRIHIDKQIPVAAGLGGGSSNAATVLAALNARYGSPLTPAVLSDLGRSLGADVPFFLFGRPALAAGIGERLEAFDSLPVYQIVVIFPGFAVSTASVFSRLNLRLTNREKKPTKALLKNMGFIAPNHLHNDLEPVAVKAYPEIGSVREKLAQAGALGVLMSGSGPSVFGLFENKASARKAATAIGKHPRWQLFVTELMLDSAGPGSDSR